MNVLTLFRLIPVAASVMLSACASFSGIEPQSSATSAADLSLVSASSVQWPQAQWWTSYNDPVLSELIAQALVQNPGIKLAQARLAKVTALTGAVQAGSLPRVDLGLQSSWERFTENGLVPPPLAGTTTTNNSLMVNATYEIDFWGKNRAALEAALSVEKAAQAEIASARLLITASIAKSYFSVARAMEQKKILQTTLDQREQLLSLTRQRVDAGMDSKQALYLSEAAIPAIRAEMIAQDEQLALSRHALAALLGQGPEATSTVAAGFPALASSVLPDAIPADLIGRRADISAARERVNAAGKQIKVAQTEFYPNVNLRAFAGLTSLGVSNWLSSGSRDYGVGPAISLPLFDGGRLRANLRGKDADYDAALESYNQTLTEAVRDVADQISSLRALALQEKQQAAMQSNADVLYQVEQQREQEGLVSKLSVLNAQSAVFMQRRAAVELKARALDLTINLNRALGGGFNDSASSGALSLTRATDTNP
jgi:NodT family efflux transporter outer membrane factor (OMF) lipoprotein